MSSFQHTHGNRYGADLSAPVSEHVASKCPTCRELFDHYCTTSGSSPSLIDLVSDVVAGQSPAQSRTAALLLRELRFAGVAVPSSIESNLLRQVLSVDTPLTWRESAAICLQGTNDQKIVDQLIDATHKESPPCVALLALRLSPFDIVEKRRQELESTAEGDLAYLYFLESLFNQTPSFNSFLEHNSGQIAGHSLLAAIREVQDSQSNSDRFAIGLKRTLAAVPYRIKDEDDWQRGMNVAVLNPFGFRVKTIEIATSDITSADNSLPVHLPPRIKGILVEAGTSRPYTGTTAPFSRELLSLTAAVYHKILKQHLAVVKEERPASTKPGTVETEPLKLPGAFEKQELSSLVPSNPETLALLGFLSGFSSPLVAAGQLTIAHALAIIEVPQLASAAKLYAARLIRYVRANQAYEAIQLLDAKLIQILSNTELTPYTRHAASVALQGASNEETIQALFRYMTDSAVGDYAAVALRGAVTPRLPYYYSRVLASTDADVRMRAYFGAVYCSNKPLQNRIRLTVACSRLLGALSETKLWQSLSRIAPFVNSVWKFAHFDAILWVGQRANRSLLTDFLRQQAIMPRIDSALSRTLQELPLAADVFRAPRDDLFITDFSVESQAARTLNADLSIHSGEQYVVHARISNDCSLTAEISDTPHLGANASAAVATWLSAMWDSFDRAS